MCSAPVARQCVSAAQLTVWAEQQLYPDSPLYNVGVYFDIHGPVDAALLEQAVRLAVADAEALRVTFRQEDDGLWQVLGPACGDLLRVVDVSGQSDPQAAARSFMSNDLATPLDLCRGPLFDHALFRIATDRFFVFLRYHHIVMDGYGQMLYCVRLFEIYRALAAGRKRAATTFGTLAQLVGQEVAYRASPRYQTDRAYWLDAFPDLPRPLSLTGRSADLAPGVFRRTVRLSPEHVEALLATARAVGIRWSVVAIAATAAYLHQLTAVDDFVLRIPVPTRTNRLSLETPGTLLNILPLRLSLSPSMSFVYLLKEASQRLRLLLKHQRYRSEDLQRDLRLPGVFAGPIVNVLSFVKEPPPYATMNQLSIGGVRDLTITFYGSANAGSGVEVEFMANPNLYSRPELTSYQDRFIRFFSAALAEITQPIGRLEVPA